MPTLDGLPWRYTVRQGGASAGRIADKLLGEGIVRSEDWHGDLPSTITYGLNRWLNEVHEMDRLEILEPNFVITDNPEELESDLTGPLDFHELLDDVKRHGKSVVQGSLNGPMCAFALTVDNWSYIKAERQIRMLEGLAPGAGYALLGLVDRALAHSIMGFLPCTALGLVEMWDYNVEDYYAQGEVPDEDHDILTVSNFLKHTPEAVCMATYSSKPLRQAKAAAKAIDPAMLRHHRRDIIVEALALGRKLGTERIRWEEVNHMSYPGVESLRSVTIGWNDEDWISRVYDDWADQLSQTAEYTPVAWCACWHPHITAGPGSFGHALFMLRETLDTIRRVDPILAWMDGGE